ncbi:MAG: MATE family efflux transporter [Ruminococcus sp.]|nr:MATE family efflux transporter [Ruminococcus sp.]
MKQELQDLTEGSLVKKILIFSIPLIISNLLQVLFNMADIAVVGQFAGSAALGSVGSTTTMVAMFTGFLIGVSSGINVLVALHYGAKDKEGLSQTVHSALIVSVIVGIGLMLVGMGCSGGILRILKTKEELLDGAVLYIRIYCLGMPAMAVYNFGNAVFSAVGDTKRPLQYLSLAGILNLVLNLFLVIVCKMDVAGVAIASAVSQYLAAILILAALFRNKDEYALRMSKMHLNKKKAIAIIKIGLPAGMHRLTIMGFSYCVSAFMDCTIAASRALGKSLAPTIIVIMGSCVFRIIWVYTIFAHYHTISSLYLLYVFSWSITAIAEIIYFAGVYRTNVKIR